MNRKTISVLLLLLFLTIVTGCSNNKKIEDNEEPKIVEQTLSCKIEVKGNYKSRFFEEKVVAKDDKIIKYEIIDDLDLSNSRKMIYELMRDAYQNIIDKRKEEYRSFELKKDDSNQTLEFKEIITFENAPQEEIKKLEDISSSDYTPMFPNVFDYIDQNGILKINEYKSLAETSGYECSIK